MNKAAPFIGTALQVTCAGGLIKWLKMFSLKVWTRSFTIIRKNGRQLIKLPACSQVVRRRELHFERVQPWEGGLWVVCVM
ncbi:hypothetical protein DX931_14185 [Bacillus cereus]|nr:hypothetical protein DX930_06930 [Bacillus cereus]KAA6479448.1 hypothetical protein DX931_14185 [Bacillus cereus]